MPSEWCTASTPKPKAIRATPERETERQHDCTPAPLWGRRKSTLSAACVLPRRCFCDGSWKGRRPAQLRRISVSSEHALETSPAHSTFLERCVQVLCCEAFSMLILTSVLDCQGTSRVRGRQATAEPASGDNAKFTSAKWLRHICPRSEHSTSPLQRCPSPSARRYARKIRTPGACVERAKMGHVTVCGRLRTSIHDVWPTYSLNRERRSAAGAAHSEMR